MRKQEPWMTDTNDPFQNGKKVDQNTLSLVQSGVMCQVGGSENISQATNKRVQMCVSPQRLKCLHTLVRNGSYEQTQATIFYTYDTFPFTHNYRNC